MLPTSVEGDTSALEPKRDTEESAITSRIASLQVLISLVLPPIDGVTSYQLHTPIIPEQPPGVQVVLITSPVPTTSLYSPKTFLVPRARSAICSTPNCHRGFVTRVTETQVEVFLSAELNCPCARETHTDKLSRLQCLQQYELLPARRSEVDLLKASIEQGLTYTPDRVLVIEGVRCYPTRHQLADNGRDLARVDYESDGVAQYGDNPPEIERRAKQLTQLDLALQSNSVALLEAEKGKLQDVGALYLERKCIKVERSRILALPVTNVLVRTHAFKFSLTPGWNLVAKTTWVNLTTYPI